MKQITLRIDEALLDKVRTAAANDDRSVRSFIVQCIKMGLKALRDA